ncbi:Vegetative incompatibility protein HET-E-1, partial [Trametes pubescens]
MPRFLDTWTGDFVWRNTLSDVHYAILSHTWRSLKDGGEQSYDDIRRLQVAVKDVDDPPDPYSGYNEHGTIFAHPELSKKIKGICKIAREAGFRLIWIDSCCIDKTSSAELSEAINSMFEWYRLSDVCYAYLEDVPDGDNLDHPESRFRCSRWHTRCWTLQELIAPKRVEFLTKSWHVLGTKLGLAITLETITGVDFNILTGQAAVDSASVARRISWAAKRCAARIEDEAYSLMGLFDVHMPPIYGEGRKAFFRLQEEIVRTVPDQSIFAWGVGSSTRLSQYSGLFASSPHDFLHGGDITPVTPSQFALMLGLQGSEDVPPLDCILTPLGVRMQLLCINVAANAKVQDTFGREEALQPCWNCESEPWYTHIVAFALLQCQDKRGSLVALPLWEPCEAAGHGMPIGTHMLCDAKWGTGSMHRAVRVTKEDLSEVLQHTSPVRFDASLLRHSSGPITFYTAPSNDLGVDFWFRAWAENTTYFRIAPVSLDNLRSLGVIPDLPLEAVLEHRAFIARITLRTQLPTEDPAAQDRGRTQTIEITLTITLTPPEIYFTRVYSAKVRAKLDVSYVVGGPLTDTGPPSLPPPPAGPPVPVVASPSTVKATPESDGDRKRPCHPRPHVSGSPVSFDDIASENEFKLYSGVHSEEDICTYRILRIALQQGQLPDSLLPDDDCVLVFIDLSGPYQHDRGIATTPAERPTPSEGTGNSSVHDATRQLAASGTSGDGKVDGPSAPSPGLATTGSISPVPCGEPSDAPGATHSSEKENTDALRRENDALRRQASLMSSQIAELTSKNTEMVSQVTDMSSQIASLSSQMATVLARLESLPAASQGTLLIRQYYNQTGFAYFARALAPISRHCEDLSSVKRSLFVAYSLR